MQDLFGVRPIDTVFLIEATKQLLRNRRVLEFSYIYGYARREGEGESWRQEGWREREKGREREGERERVGGRKGG